MTSRRLVIIGNGVAGVSAAQEARKTDPHAQLILIGDEPLPFYYRSSLTEWITGELTDQNLLARTPAFYQDMQIELVKGSAASVHAEEHRLQFSDGREMGYDALCIATGARARRIAINGLDATRVLTYRTKTDADAIQTALREAPRVLIVGGGVLGLELAGGMKRMGLPEVGLIEYQDHIARPILDEPLARWLESRIREDGYLVFLNDTIDHVDGDTAVLSSGNKCCFDLLVESVGITPVFPEVPGLEIGLGIRIDAQGRTNLADIFACGDCTESFNHKTKKWQATRIWHDCARQGRAAGAAMAGGSNPDQKQGFFNCSYIYNELYAYIGEPHGAGTVFRFDAAEAHRKIRLEDGRLAGALLVNNRRGAAAILQCLGQDVSSFGEALAHPDFDWNALSGENWDYHFY